MSIARRIEQLEREAAEDLEGGGWVPPLELMQAFVTSKPDQPFTWPEPDPAMGWEYVSGAEAFTSTYELMRLLALATIEEPEPPPEPPRPPRPTAPQRTAAEPSPPDPPPSPPAPPRRPDQGLPDYLKAILRLRPDYEPSGW